MAARKSGHPSGHPSPIELMRMVHDVDAGSIHKGSPEEYVDKEGWSASGNLIGFRSNAVTLQARFKRIDSYTIQFGLSGVSTAVYIQTLAEIFWRVEGNEVRRLISVLNGSAISGTAEGVRIKITDFTGVLGVGSTYVASCQITPGLRGASSQPPFLEIDNNLSRGSSPRQLVAGGGGSTNFNVPQDAGINSVLISFASVTPGTTIPDGDVSITQIVGAVTTKSYDGAIKGLWIPLSPGCTDILVTNANAIDIAVTMSWGVEG